MLSAKRDVSAAKRFFKKMMRADHRRLPFTISIDKNAAYPETFVISQEEEVLPHDCKLRRVKYLNNIIERDHRFIKKRVRACLGYRSFDTAERTLQGVEAINMMRKGKSRDWIEVMQWVRRCSSQVSSRLQHSQPSLISSCALK
jgi:IS6 family transposase